MKSGKLICVLVLLLLVYCGQLFAKPVSAEKAQQAVQGWLKADARPFGATLGQEVRKAEVFTNDSGEPIYYIVYLQPSGFVIVPADDSVEPIIGFVSDGSYNPSLDNPLGALVTRDLNGRIAEVRKSEGLKATGAMTRAIESQAKWEKLESQGGGIKLLDGYSVGLDNINDVRVPPLVKSKWGQTTCCNDPNLACYNYYTPLSDPWDPFDNNTVSSPGTPFPYGDPNNYPCGCVATAMAQLMRFHEHPQVGIGRVQHWITVNSVGEWAWTRGGDALGGLYYWDRMVYEPNCDTNEMFRQAIGALCYDAGVSVGMNYGPNGSSARLRDAALALTNPSYFNYSNAVYAFSGWGNIGAGLNGMINPNLDYSHPVLLSIAGASDSGGDEYSRGHAVVCDGYGFNANTPYHHLNMGWEGLHNAWYNLPNILDYNCVYGCVYNVFITGAGEIISGRVTDTSGKALSGATVTAIDQTTLLTYPATTNNKGIYAIAHVPSNSNYIVNVTKPRYGFASAAATTGTSLDWFAVSGNVWPLDFALTPEPPRYVDSSATGANDGSSWDNAYNYLQDALADPCAWVILVADGTYKPDQGGGHTLGDRNASFILKNGVAIYGGFAGSGAPDPNARDIKLYETILSGDLAGNDVYVADPCNLLNDPCRAENSYNVVTSNGTDANTIFDGFTVTAGNANTSVWPTGNGGGILNVDSNCTNNNCKFVENSAEQGGAMYDHHSSMLISNCIFIRNSSRYDGGAMTNDTSSFPVLVNCNFTFNKCGNNGGAILNSRQSNATITNCLFNYNSTKRGGGIRNNTSSCPTIANCTFRGNLATERGGGISDNNASPVITNCILWGNTSPIGPQLNDASGSAATVNYSDVQGGWGGAGIGNINADPYFEDANGSDGIIGTDDDNLRLLSNSPCIDKGNNAGVPADTTDLDGDGDTTEQTPLDLDLHPRFADGDCNGIVTVDMGAYEFGYFYCYVDKDAPGSNNGSNWYNAYHHLQDALADPCAPVIWVAQGTYYPDSNSAVPDGSGDRAASFVLKNGVSIYGGFAGFGAPNPNARDTKLYETILSGDLAGNDVYVADPCNLLTAPTRGENSYHVVVSRNTDATAILDGFTITAGNANSGVWPKSNGGGMFSEYYSNCIVNNCTFIENSSGGGGAMFNNYLSNLCITNCTFYRNAGGFGGGGIANCVSSPTIVNCRFISNKGTDPGNNAGALYNIQNCNPIITNCLFVNNSAQYGGAVSNIHVSYPTITNCTFRGNFASGGVGGINDYNNVATTVTNCIFWGDTPPEICDGLGSAATVNYSDVQGGWGGAGVGNINADPRFVDANGQDGVIGTLDDNLRLLSSSPCIDKGNNASVPADTTDLDGDGNTTEQTPLDLDLRPRFADGNCDGNSVVDMGAYEFSYAYAGDFDGDCDVDFIDFAILASSWLQNNPLVDIAPAPAGDGIVDIKDLAVLCDNWLAGK